jgi:hypothetical protein
LKLDISNNEICSNGSRVLAEALEGNQVMTELNIASNNLGSYLGVYSQWGKDTAGLIAIANSISDMGGLSKITFSGDHYYSKPVTMETSMTEADFSGKVLEASGATVLAAFLPKCQ